MSENNKPKLEIRFAPGALEQLEAEMTPEELQELMNALAEIVQDPELLNERSVELDFDSLPDDEREIIQERLDQLEADSVSVSRNTLH